MAPALFTDDYIKRMCPENQPIPLRRMSVLDPTTEPAYLARGFTGIRYVPQPHRPPRNVETLARTMASMRMGISGYGDDDVRQQRAVIQGFVEGGAAAAPAPNGPAAMDDGAYFDAAGFQYGARDDPPAMDMDDSDDDSEGPDPLQRYADQLNKNFDTKLNEPPVPQGTIPSLDELSSGKFYDKKGRQYGARDDPEPANNPTPKRKNESGEGKFYNKKGFQYGARDDPEPEATPTSFRTIGPKRGVEGLSNRSASVSARQSEARSAVTSRQRKNYTQNRTNRDSEFMAASRGGGRRAEQGTNLTVAQRRRRRDEEEFQRGAAGDRKGKNKNR